MIQDIRNSFSPLFILVGVLLCIGAGRYFEADGWTTSKWAILAVVIAPCCVFVAKQLASSPTLLFMYLPAMVLVGLNCQRLARWNAPDAIPGFLSVCLISLAISLIVLRSVSTRRLFLLWDCLLHVRKSFLSQRWHGFVPWFLQPHIVALLIFAPIFFVRFRYIQFYDFYTAIYREWEYHFTGVKSGSRIVWMQAGITVECLPVAAGVGTLVFIMFGLGTTLKQRMTIRQVAGSTWYWAVISLLFPAWLFAVNNFWNYIYVDAGDRFDWDGYGNTLGMPNSTLLALSVLHVGGVWLGLTGPILVLRFSKRIGLRLLSLFHVCAFFAAIPMQYVYWIEQEIGWGSWLLEIPLLCISAMLQPLYLQKLLQKKGTHY